MDKTGLGDYRISKFKKCKQLSKSGQLIEETISKLRNGDRNTLARLITLAESSRLEHQQTIHEVLAKILPFTGGSVRLGITGAPGVGKSTFIEGFGTYLTSNNHKVAVLSVDPSSPVSKGSILGDKTRMEKLSKDPSAFIRPTASQSFQGGVAHATRESILLCEAAGFDVVIVETVGVGQSEFSVKDMTDCFVLLMLAGAGDELQGIKKGIMEMADLILITKADGDNLKKAGQAQAEFQHALNLIMKGGNWIPTVIATSALEETGLVESWNLIQKFIEGMKADGSFQSVRKKQLITWMNDHLTAQLKKQILDQDAYGLKWIAATERVEKNEWTIFKAVDYLLNKPTI
jgi:LAO/AO transport system kinase